MKKGKILIITPQFERPKNWPAVYVPKNKQALMHAIENFNENELKKIGFCRWEEGSELMLIPGDCYNINIGWSGLLILMAKKKNSNTENQTMIIVLVFCHTEFFQKFNRKT